MRAIRSGSVSLDRSGRDCRGLRLYQVFGTPCLGRCPRGLEDRSGHQPPEIRFRLLSAHELGLVIRFEMRLTDKP